MDELTLALDLAVYTAPPGRTRALDRYARSARFAPGSDEARVLDAMRHARFTIGQVKSRHEAAGLIITDILRDTEFWLVDEGLEMSLPVGTGFATRYYTPDGFAMTAGYGLPVDQSVLVAALDATPRLMKKSHAEAADDRHFAEAIFRAAIQGGASANMRLRDPLGSEDFD